MKRYFFLDQSDYFTHFLDLAADELKRPWREMSLTKLQSLMDLVLRNPSSITVNDVFKEDLKVDTSSHGLVEQLILINSIKGQAQGQEPGSSRLWPDETAGSAAMEGIMATSEFSMPKKKVLSGKTNKTLFFAFSTQRVLQSGRRYLTALFFFREISHKVLRHSLWTTRSHSHSRLSSLERL
jgi:gamma-tubulin complex component 2